VDARVFDRGARKNASLHTARDAQAGANASATSAAAVAPAVQMKLAVPRTETHEEVPKMIRNLILAAGLFAFTGTAALAAPKAPVTVSHKVAQAPAGDAAGDAAKDAKKDKAAAKKGAAKKGKKGAKDEKAAEPAKEPAK
jgi:hypothetical protein